MSTDAFTVLPLSNKNPTTMSVGRTTSTFLQQSTSAPPERKNRIESQESIHHHPTDSSDVDTAATSPIQLQDIEQQQQEREEQKDIKSSEIHAVSSSSPTTERKKGKKVAKNESNGVLTPAVILAKKTLGDEKLNKVRAKAISVHSDTIGKFVETADTKFGNAVLRRLFNMADTNHDGLVDEKELAEALQKLGFVWLKEKQVRGIFSRGDKDKNGTIDVDEWIAEAPKTLRTNLTKLAKKNGHDLGLLA